MLVQHLNLVQPKLRFFADESADFADESANGIADGMRKGAQFSSWQITSTAHRTCVCGRSHDNQGKENKTSHHHRTNKRAQSEHKQVHAACNTNTFCAISKSLIQSHAAIENRHANNTPGIKVARTRFLCVAQCAPAQPM